MNSKRFNWLKLGMLLACLVFFAACGGGGGGDSSTNPPTTNKVPVASFTSQTTGLSVNFTDTSINSPTSWHWDFGDGATSSEQNPVHTYAVAGSYRPSLVATNAIGSNVKFETTVTVSAPVVNPPARTSLAAVPTSDLVEKVDVLINQAHITAHPELANKVAVLAMINNINLVLAKDPKNKKRYELNEPIVYPDADFNRTTDRISNNPAYIKNNNHFVGNPSYGGTALLFWYSVGNSPLLIDMLPKFFVDNGSGTGYSTVQSIGGKTYNVSYIAYLGFQDYLLAYRDVENNYMNGFSSQDAGLRGVLHEMVGHGTTGVPEQYSLSFTDKSGTLPNLSYDFNALYFEDPMTSGDVNKYNILQIKFSLFNSWLIAHNANHQLDLWQIANVVKTMAIKIKVVDTSGNPVSGATVVSYGAVATSGGSWGIAKNMTGPPLETRITGADGITSLTNRINTSWFVEGIKASSGSLRGGNVLNSYDMQAAYWMLNQDTFELVITVR